MKMKILIAGDDFTPALMFKEEIEKKLAPLGKDLEFEFFDIEIDEKSVVKGLPGIKEYFGTPQEIIDKIHSVEILVITFAPITEEVLDAADKLRVIGCGRGGPVNVNVGAATKRGIPVLNTPGRNADAVADFTLGLIIALVRNIVTAHNWIKNGDWVTPREDTFEKPTGPELNGRVLGLLGVGAVGALVAKRAKPFGLEIWGYDPFIPKERFDEIGVKHVEDINTLIKGADIVSVHARLPKGSKPLISSKEFDMMKKTAYLINTARAIAVDQAALVKALQEKKIAGAALDVYNVEPIDYPNDPLLKLDNVLLTPHAAGVSYDIPRRTGMMIAEGLQQFLSEGTAPYVVNREVLKGK
jgi:D-3-phosphoglycerate dehydrogenase